MKAEAKQPPTSIAFEQVQDEIEKRIKYERRKKAVDKILTKLASRMIIGNREHFIEQCLKKIYASANQ